MSITDQDYWITQTVEQMHSFVTNPELFMSPEGVILTHIGLANEDCLYSFVLMWRPDAIRSTATISFVVAEIVDLIRYSNFTANTEVRFRSSFELGLVHFCLETSMLNGGE